jgi:hypothetical protein
MLLMDSITELAARIEAKAVRPTLTDAGAAAFGTANLDPIMQGVPALRDKLVGTPRFLLGADATRTMVELNLGRPKVMFEAMRHLVIPYPRMWVEWDDADRQRLRDRFPWENLSYKELRPLPGRVGFLLEAEPGGRTGTATWVWNTPSGGAEGWPSIGAVQPYFDLDRKFALSPLRVEGLMNGNLARLWLDNPVQLDALFDIWGTCRHEPSEWGKHYFAALDDPLAIALSYGDVVGEYITIWAILLMLTSARKTVELRPVDRGKLNKARAKKREPLLLDHTQVILHIDPHLRQAQIRQPLSYQRKSPRVHLVSSYLNRRGTKYWIVQPFLRGSGETIHRVTRVQS